jgi:NAD+ kinase
VSPRHVGFHLPSGESSGSSSPDSLLSYAAQQGTRDDLHQPRLLSGKSQIPTDRDLDLEAVKTPTPGSLVHGRGRGHSRSRSFDQHEPRAFAVWGHDESDSNTSDSES